MKLKPVFELLPDIFVFGFDAQLFSQNKAVYSFTFYNQCSFEVPAFHCQGSKPLSGRCVPAVNNASSRLLQ